MLDDDFGIFDEQPASRWLIHGLQGRGKTTFAAEFPRPVMMLLEDGLGDIAIPTYKRRKLTSWRELLDGCRALGAGDHGFQTLIIDSLSAAQPLLYDYVCEPQNNSAGVEWRGIETPGYGRGYVEAEERLSRFLGGLDRLRDAKGMTIILIAHSHVVESQDPQLEAHKTFAVNLQRRLQAAVLRWADVVGFLEMEKATEATGSASAGKTLGKTSGARRLYVDPHPAYEAKNRYGMPNSLRIRKGAGFEAVRQYLPENRDAVVNDDHVEMARASQFEGAHVPDREVEASASDAH